MSSSVPAWLRQYVLVTGTLPSAPLDLPARFQRATEALEAAGWSVVVRSIGTDFEGPLGIPIPRDQPLELLLYRPGATFTAEQAQAALERALRSVSLGYSAIGAWLRELTQEVVAPTMLDAARAALEAATLIKDLAPWAAGLYLLTSLSNLAGRR